MSNIPEASLLDMAESISIAGAIDLETGEKSRRAFHVSCELMRSGVSSVEIQTATEIAKK